MLSWPFETKRWYWDGHNWRCVDTVDTDWTPPKPEPKKPHPLAIQDNKSGALGMKAGDHVKHDLDGKTGRADEFLSDGDCLITWDDGTYGCVKWNNLSPSPSPLPPEPTPEPVEPTPHQITDYDKGLADGLKSATGAQIGVKRALIIQVFGMIGTAVSRPYAEGFEEGVRRSA